MGFSIVVLLVGIPLGLLMLLRPKKMWWTFDAWKYRNPEANEPSDAAYGMTALGGLGLIIGAIFFAAVFWSADSDYKDVQARQQAEKDRKQAIEDYVPPPAVDKGQLPFVGYTVEKLDSGRVRYEVFYLRPTGSYSSDVKAFGNSPKGWFNCVTRVGSDTRAVPASVSGHLSWEPTGPPAAGEENKCTVGDLAAGHEMKSDSVYLAAEQEIVTDSAIVDRTGKVLVPAGPGNVLPRLDAAPTR